MTLTYDPKTAYAHLWQYVPGVATIKLQLRDGDGEGQAPIYLCKGVQADPNSPDWQQLAGGLMVAPGDDGFYLWGAGSGAPDPPLGSVITLDSDSWIVKAITVSRFGPQWVVVGVPALEDTFGG